MPKYSIVESVGRNVEHVHDYEDLERHHPSRGNERGRVYGTVNGEREELLGNYRGTPTVSRDGDYYVSKDLVLQAGGSSSVAVPAVASGYIGRIDPSDGIVQIYDRPASDPNREMIAQYRHLDLRNTHLQAGDRIEYGQSVGIQGGFNNGNPSAFGKHVHIDINTSYLPQMERYVRDLDSGAITTDRRPPAQDNLTGPARVSDVSGNGRSVHSPGGNGSQPRPEAMADGVLRKDERGPDVQNLQDRLNQLGFRDAAGHALTADGKFGQRTKEAVQAFQRAHGLEDDGIVGRDTFNALRNAQRADAPARSADPARSPLLSDANHPDNAMYRQAVTGLEKLGGFRNHQDLERAAATLTYDARVSGMNRIDHVVPNASGTGLFAVQGEPTDPGHRRAFADRDQAVQQTVEQSTQKLQQDVPAMAPQAAQPSQAQAQRPMTA
ncbi:peptidoglycan-binding protein [Lysobacter sp. BMK333-48F3]|uniref:peptidoglycan-binding domain-containing protein n=1 Tax=Lysobacter sp. BMK333-48F3 TaxID=2867962 RepID=UPI001C8B7C44|nr:peptidoglycan-binding protein [Lysobacter sp. BMK333-48F3]MBX9403393.1 peptidoglycan-binding protein [Lysobacter sp. BMK333-48F3]